MKYSQKAKNDLINLALVVIDRVASVEKDTFANY